MAKTRATQLRKAKSKKQKCNATKPIRKQQQTNGVVDLTCSIVLNEIIDDVIPATTTNTEEPSSTSATTATEEQQPSTSGFQKNMKKVKNVSMLKLKNSSFNAIENSPSKRQKTRKNTLQLGLRKEKLLRPPSGYKIIDLSLLQDSLENFAVCAKCKKGKVTIMLNSAKKYGLAEEYNLSCDKCNYTVSSNTSKRTFVNQKSSAYDVNVRSVLASQSMGHTALEQFCATMDLPNPIHVAPYTKIQKGLSQSAQEVADDIMKDAGVRLFNHMKTGEPDKIKSTKFGDLAYVPVTVDGTWQKRGHSSKTGVIFVLSVHTGEILDYELKTLFCQACNIHPPTSPDYENWKKKHSPHCNINHVGSSGKMESDGATEIFCRSIEKHNLVYSTFVGDGDTGTFGRVKEARFVKYGDIYPVEKEECVGHIQKRMGKGLRDYKKSMTSKTLAGEKKKVLVVRVN